MRWGMKPLRAALFMVVLVALAAPTVALAAPPANDDFEDREVLTGALPIEVTRSNVEATKEEGEYIPGLAAAGHSIWFEWEAPDSGWVTIGACDNDLPTILGVFTGTAVNALTPAAGGNADEGPDCPYSQRQYTFKAVSGTKYAIGVDGNIFHLPEAPTPVTEGDVVLRIEETPPPPNDDFADATPVEGEITTEPGGDRFYFAHTQGYNWTATTEPGEPDEAGPSGASVWYTWTAPESGTYNFGSPCCGGALFLNLDLYSGNALGELTPVSVGEEFAKVALTAGQTLRIRVSGDVDSGTGEPDVANFDFNIGAVLPKADSQASNPFEAWSQPSPPPPDTKVVARTLRPRVGLAMFRFGSATSGSSFQCKLDKRAFKPCTSPKTYRRLKPGRHTFKVRAVSASGLADPSPAVRRFSIAAPRR